jgi:hypothetical protein
MATLQNHLENLRAKPAHVRKRIAFWSSFGITAVIFAFWLTSFTATVTGRPNPVTSVAARIGSPTESLIAAAGTAYDDIRDLIFGPKKVVYSSVEVRPGK